MSIEHSPARSSVKRLAFKIAEFCEAHRISRSKFYILKAKGLAPRITDVDGAQIITVEDAAAWRRERAEEATATARLLKLSPERAEHTASNDFKLESTATS